MLSEQIKEHLTKSGLNVSDICFVTLFSILSLTLESTG